MQQFFSALRQVFGKSIVILSMISLLTLSSSFIFVQQPSFAAPLSTGQEKLMQQDKLDQDSQAANQREQNYERQINAEKNPDKVYQENLKAERRANPDEGFVQKTVEKAEELVDKVTDKE